MGRIGALSLSMLFCILILLMYIDMLSWYILAVWCSLIYFLWLSLDSSVSTKFLFPVLSHFGHWWPNFLKGRAIGLGFWPWAFEMVLVCPSMLLVVQKNRIPSHTITIFVLCFRFFYILDTCREYIMNMMNMRNGSNPGRANPSVR